MKYTCNDIFMIRTPSLPVNTFSEFMNFEGHGIEDFIQEHDLSDFMIRAFWFPVESCIRLRKEMPRAIKRARQKKSP